MSKFTSEDFKYVVRKQELREISNSRYMLLNCNLFLEFNDEQGLACAHGIIPMELAMQIYETFKDVKEQQFTNCRSSYCLKNPEKIDLKHPNIDIYKIMFTANQTGKSIEQVWDEVRKEVLKNDFDNCYIDFFGIYSPEALDWYINTVRDYHSKKKEINKQK